MSMVSEALLSLLTCRHGDNEDLYEYTARQRTNFDHVTRFLGGPVVVWHDLKKKHKEKSFTVEELEELCNTHHARFEAYMLMANSNQKSLGTS